MAGAGVRVFLPGEVLTATLVNTYLQDQVVAIFDTSTARDAAFGDIGNIDNMPELVEGRVCYVRDTNDLQYYSGVAWVSISEGSLVNTITAKGDILAGTAAGAVDNVAVGTNEYLLVADSNEATGVKWGQIALAGIPDGLITNDKINASAGIFDTKLATISTAGKVSNSATTATSSNTNSAIVARDSSGNFTATTANLTSASVSGTVSASAATLVSASVSGKATLATADVTTVLETASIVSASATGTINIDFSTNPTVYYTGNASADWTLNVRGTSSVTLNNTLSTGQIATVTFLATIGATQRRPTVFQIDGSAVTPKWMGGTAPTTGNASSIDAYTLAIIKTGNAAFTVLASQTRFA